MKTEGVFGNVAEIMVKNGWSIFPQEATSARTPGTVDKATINIYKDHDLVHKYPDEKNLKKWINQCNHLNVACVFGPASANTFAIDIDVLDENMSDEILDISKKILGTTPFARQGQYPKIALIYRHAPEDKIYNISRRFSAVGNPSIKSDYGLEILATGKILTFHGYHHRTGRFFQWLDKNPIEYGPETAPLTTSHKIKDFLQEIDRRFPFYRGLSFDLTDDDAHSGLKTDYIGGDSGDAISWVEDANGIVIDGREQYLFNLVLKTIARNFSRLTTGAETIDGFTQNIATAVICKFQETAAMTGRWTESFLRKEVGSRAYRLVRRMIEDHEAGRSFGSYAPSASVLTGDNTFTKIVVDGDDDEFDFLTKNHCLAQDGQQLNKNKIKGCVTANDNQQQKPSLAIPADRSDVMNTVNTRLQTAISAFFDDVYGGADQQDRVHILKAPTGAGKTSKTIQFIADDPRTYENGCIDEEAMGPIIFLLPTYANIEEVRQRAMILGLDPKASDQDLMASAASIGLTFNDDISTRLEGLRAEATGCELKTMVYKGKIKAGCLQKDKMEAAISASISTSSFCHARLPADRHRPVSANKPKTDKAELEDVYCEYYHECQAIAQKAEIARSHIVFLPHAFMALAIPDELKKARAVIADERIHHLFLHTDSFLSDVLSSSRKKPRLTKAERAQDRINGDDSATAMLNDRNIAAGIVLAGITEGRQDPATFLWEHEDVDWQTGNTSRNGHAYVQSALRVCGSALQKDGVLTPETSLEEIIEICSQPTGRGIRQEWRFWKLIDERMTKMQEDQLKKDAITQSEQRLRDHENTDKDAIIQEIAELKNSPDHAIGDRDYRIQILTDIGDNGDSVSVIRMSWRTEPNWMGTPMLLLDASASEPVIAKIMNIDASKIITHDVVDDPGAALKVRTVVVGNQTFSNASAIGDRVSTAEDRLAAATVLANIRTALTTIASLYGDGRVVAGASILMRKLINDGWVAPENIDWCHYGALRGLDAFKNHAAAVSIGRMELPVRVVDGIVAALTYDDPVPEAPFDVHGTGIDDSGRALRTPIAEKTLRMRDHRTVKLPVSSFAGAWAKIIQQQYREEETLQFVGRLRPIYRQGRTPVWYCLSSVAPEDVVVDAVIHINDLIAGHAPLWEGARRSITEGDHQEWTQGIIDARILVRSQAFEKTIDARKAMADWLNHPETKRFRRGYRCLHWSVANEKGIEASWVMVSNNNPETRLQTALRAWTDIDAVIEDVDATPILNAPPRAPDTVQVQIGSADALISRERSRMMAIAAFCNNKDGPKVEKTASNYEDDIKLLKAALIAQEDRKKFTKMHKTEQAAFISICSYWDHKKTISKEKELASLDIGLEERLQKEGLIPVTYEQFGSFASDDSFPENQNKNIVLF